MPVSETRCCDCMEYMKSLPDKYFDLACTDPPFGDGLHAEDGGCKGWFTKYNQSLQNDNGCSQDVNVERERERGTTKQQLRFHGGSKNPNDPWNKYKRIGDEDGRNLGGEIRKKIITWDVAPKKEYFDELFRVSRNQIIWGGNYFDLPPTRCFLVWRKLTISEAFSMAMAEYAWTSFNSNAKVFECAPQGKVSDPRFHPTAKPIALYDWIFKNYAKPGDKIFDSHMGSQSSRIAAWKAGLDYYGCEIDKQYYKLGEERFARHTAQMNLFVDKEE